MTLRCGFHDEKRTRCARPDSHIGECIFVDSIKSNQPCPAAADQGNHTIYIGDTVCYMPEVGKQPGFTPSDCTDVVMDIQPPPDDTYDWPEHPKVLTAKHGWQPARLFRVVTESLRPSLRPQPSPDMMKLSLAALRHENVTLSEHNSTLIKQVASLLEQKVDTGLEIKALQAELASRPQDKSLEFALADLTTENRDLDASLNRLLTEKLQLQQTLGREKAANDALQAEIDAYKHDLAQASGELLLEMPEPHSKLAVVVTANRLLTHRNQTLQVERAQLLDENTRFGSNNAALTSENNRLIGDINALRAANARILRGDFTADELQNFCHNLPESPQLATQFCDGCDRYQKQLFGSCRSDDYKQQIAELSTERDSLIQQLEDANYWRERHCKEAEARGDQTNDQFEEIQRYKRIVGEQQFEIRELHQRLRQLRENADSRVHGKFTPPSL